MFGSQFTTLWPFIRKLRVKLSLSTVDNSVDKKQWAIVAELVCKRCSVNRRSFTILFFYFERKKDTHLKVVCTVSGCSEFVNIPGRMRREREEKFKRICVTVPQLEVLLVVGVTCERTKHKSPWAKTSFDKCAAAIIITSAIAIYYISIEWQMNYCALTLWPPQKQAKFSIADRSHLTGRAITDF